MDEWMDGWMKRREDDDKQAGFQEVVTYELGRFSGLQEIDSGVFGRTHLAIQKQESLVYDHVLMERGKRLRRPECDL